MHLFLTKAMTECPPNTSSVTIARDASEAPNYLLANCLVSADGFGPPIALGPLEAQPLVIRLQIDHTVQHKSLSISVWGSADGAEWGDRPLAALPPKTYCGDYLMRLDLSQHPEVRYLRVGWKTSSWHQTNAVTLFGFSVFLEGSDFRRRGAVSVGAGVSAA